MPNFYLTERFGEALRVARRDRRVTQLAAAEKAGISRAQVMRIEKGENVGVDDIHKLAFALGFTLALAETIRPTWENAREFFLGDEDGE